MCQQDNTWIRHIRNVRTKQGIDSVSLLCEKSYGGGKRKKKKKYQYPEYQNRKIYSQSVKKGQIQVAFRKSYHDSQGKAEDESPGQ